ncbi:hypothetical protein SLS56_005008 [Neofusicoccum ribis]|uniref:Fucose-specific lectin n=1 Tax=Neofusicoccum ribis TaxID=45134 RepID=A0ABR3SUV5_9PEZI
MTHLTGNQGHINISSEQQRQGYITLEVDQNSDLPEVDLTANGSQLPEYLNTTGKKAVFTPIYTDTEVERRICGLRRKNSWIALAVAILVVIVVIVGASVGATRNGGSGNAASSTSNDNSSNVSEALRRGIAPNSKLAAANYTDVLGVEHSQVYYQDYSLQIWMADWDSSVGNWTFSKVLAENNNTAVNPKNGTPIATYNFWKGSGNQSDFRCLFLDDSNYVRFLWAPLQTGADGRWQLVEDKDGVLLAGVNSSLTEYTRQCNDTIGCNSADFTLYETPDDGPMLYYPRGNADSSSSSSATKFSVENVTAQEGTAMAVAPIPRSAKRNLVYPTVGLYLIDDEGYLAEIYGGYNSRWRDTGLTENVQQLPVDLGAQLAAMSQYRLDDFNLQIMITKTDGGVKMAYMNGDWNKQDPVEGMDSVLPLSPIAANQLGRVYALESSDNGTQLVEWIRITGTDPSFKRVGVIDTTKT